VDRSPPMFHAQFCAALFVGFFVTYSYSPSKAAAGFVDCNNNGVDDTVDISSGESTDCNQDGVPDDCEFDCDNNGLPDDCDPDVDFVTFGVSADGRSDDVFTFNTAAGDLNGDLYPDVVASDPLRGQVLLFENNGSGDFGQPTTVVSDLTLPFFVGLLDADEDGWLDILVCATSDSESPLIWLRNESGTGVFSTAQFVVNDEFEASFIAIGDLDGDDVDDIAFTQELGNTVGWIPNLPGGGHFGVPQILTNDFRFANTLDIADVDNDGDNDLVTTGQAGGFPPPQGLVLFRNVDGDGSFVPEEPLPSISVGIAVRLLDIDDDGDKDIYIGNAIGHGIPNTRDIWLSNLNGLGSSWAAQPVPLSDTSQFTTGIAVGDLDSDGVADVVRPTTSGFLWYKWIDETTDQLFRQVPRTYRSTIFEHRGLEIIDVDLDGDPDVLAGGIGEPSFFYVAINTFADCNADGLLDRCQIDSNGNGIIDECDLPLGDLNCDGIFNLADIPAFATALIDEAAYQQQYAPCERLRADMSNDLIVDSRDVADFVLSLTQ